MCFVLTGRYTNGDERSASRRKHLQRSQHIGLSDSKSPFCVCLVCDEVQAEKLAITLRQPKVVKNVFMAVWHLLKCPCRDISFCSWYLLK